MADILADFTSVSHFSSSTKLDDYQIDTLTHTSLEAISPELHSHLYYEVQMAQTGSYCIHFEDKQLFVSGPDTLCLIPPNCYHSCHYTEEETTRQIGLQFRCRQRPGQVHHTPLSEAIALLPTDAPTLLTGVSHLCTVLSAIADELSAPDLSSESLLESLLRQFYIHLFRSLKKHSSPQKLSSNSLAENDSRSGRYHKIEVFLNDNFAKPVTENDLAEALSLSKRQTSRIMQQLYGRTFHRRLEEQRMHMALQYLLLTDIPVEAIALKIGYSTASGFFLAFKKNFNMTPAEYRNTHRLR